MGFGVVRRHEGQRLVRKHHTKAERGAFRITLDKRDLEVRPLALHKV